MIGSKNYVFYLAALHMFVASTYGKMLEIVNNKPQLRERRKIKFFSWHIYLFIYLFLNLYIVLLWGWKSKSQIAFNPELSTNGLKLKLCNKIKKNDEMHTQTTATAVATTKKDTLILMLCVDWAIAN